MPHLNLAREMAPLYNVDKAVGRGCPNQRGDVFLVQYFIRSIVDRTPAWTNYPEGEGPPVVDGHFTIVTEMWIESFQNRMRFEMGELKPRH